MRDGLRGPIGMELQHYSAFHNLPLSFHEFDQNLKICIGKGGRLFPCYLLVTVSLSVQDGTRHKYTTKWDTVF
jgi:hypothetical protein